MVSSAKLSQEKSVSVETTLTFTKLVLSFLLFQGQGSTCIAQEIRTQLLFKQVKGDVQQMAGEKKNSRKYNVGMVGPAVPV